MKALNKILTNTTSKLAKNVNRVDSAVDGLLNKFNVLKNSAEQGLLSNIPGPLQNAASQVTGNISNQITDTVDNQIQNVTNQAQEGIDNVTSQVQATAGELSNRALAEGQELANNIITKEQLLEIVKIKNQLQSGLNQIYSTFSKVNDISTKTLSAVEVADLLVEGIKIIPSPPFAPTSLFASILDFLDKFLDDIEKNLGMIPPLANFLTTATGNILAKLEQLDNLINLAITFLTKDMTQAEKNEFIAEVGNVAATAGDFNSEALNVADDKVLEKSLSPLSSNPYVYQKTGYPTADWRLTIEHNQDNEFSFPQRRIRMENINDSEDNIYRGVVTYGPINNGWSFSSSVKVLIEEAKYNIEGLDDRYWARANRNYTPN
jgi:hypothetical protein